MNKKKQYIGLLGLVVFGAIGYQWWLAYATLHPMSMVVAGFQGHVTIDGKPLTKEGADFNANGSVIRVAEGSILNIKLSDESFFQAFENTSATIQKAKANQDKDRFDLEFKLDTGEIMRNIPTIRKTSEGYSSSLFTNEVNIGVRGTRYGAVSEQGLTKAMVYRGRVALGTKGNEELSLPKDYGTVTKRDEAPEKPSRLPVPPVLQSDFSGERIELASINMNWRPVPQAKNYLLEVAVDQAFNIIVHREYTNDIYYEIRQLPFDSNFYWRVASVDQRGLRGHSSPPDTFQYKYHHSVLKQNFGNKNYQGQADKAIKGFPEDAELLHDIAKYMSSIGNNEEALKYYNQTIQLENPAPEVLLGRGTTLRLLGRRNLAEIDFGKVLSMPTDGSDALYGLGLIELDRGETGKAIEYFYQVIARNPKHNKVHVSAAQAWEKIGNLAKARRHLDLHRESYPEDPEAKLVRMRIDRSSG